MATTDNSLDSNSEPNGLVLPKWCHVLLQVERTEREQLKRNYLERLMRECEVAASFLKRTVNQFEALGMLTRRQDKTRKYLELTEAGQDLARHAYEIERLLRERGDAE